MKLLQKEIELTPEQLAEIAAFGAEAQKQIGFYMILAEPKPRTHLLRLTAITQKTGARINAVIKDVKSRGPRGANPKCKSCYGSGYIVGSCGSHDCDCTREV